MRAYMRYFYAYSNRLFLRWQMRFFECAFYIATAQGHLQLFFISFLMLSTALLPALPTNFALQPGTRSV